MAVVPSKGVGVTVAESLIRNLGKVSDCSDHWGMKLNASMTKIVSMSRTMHPCHPHLTNGGTVMMEHNNLSILGVTFDSKMTFENHLCSVSRAVSQRVVI